MTDLRKATLVVCYGDREMRACTSLAEAEQYAGIFCRHGDSNVAIRYRPQLEVHRPYEAAAIAEV